MRTQTFCLHDPEKGKAIVPADRVSPIPFSFTARISQVTKTQALPFLPCLLPWFGVLFGQAHSLEPEPSSVELQRSSSALGTEAQVQLGPQLPAPTAAAKSWRGHPGQSHFTSLRSLTPPQRNGGGGDEMGAPAQTLLQGPRGRRQSDQHREKP